MNARNRTAALFIALIMAIFLLTGCKETAPATLYDAGNVYIECAGRKTTVYDRAGNAEYIFTLRPVRKKAARISGTRTTADTDTIKLQTVYGLIIVTDKSTGKTIYIKGVR